MATTCRCQSPMSSAAQPRVDTGGDVIVVASDRTVKCGSKETLEDFGVERSNEATSVRNLRMTLVHLKMESTFLLAELLTEPRFKN
jgi:hypothetical protein